VRDCQTKTKLGRSCLAQTRYFSQTGNRKDPIGKRPLGRPKLRWEDGVKREAESTEPGTKWREAADRDRW